MSLKDETQYLLKKYHLTPDKDAGQHFMVDENVLRDVIKMSGVTTKDAVLEVGPGLGVLTQRLCDVAGRVVAVETDAAVMPLLHKLETTYANLTIVRNDILKVRVCELMDNKPFAIVSNLPYQITSRFLRRMLEDVMQRCDLRSVTVVIQEEVATRAVAQPGRMNLLALSVQFFADPIMGARIHPDAFYPAPQVNSAILHMTPKDVLPYDDPQYFFRVARIGFSAKRKKLSTNLVNGRLGSKEEVEKIFTKLGISANARAQELSLEYWVALVEEMRGQTKM